MDLDRLLVLKSTKRKRTVCPTTSWSDWFRNRNTHQVCE